MQQLSESRDPAARREAIVQLSAFPADERIARALLTARMFDKDATVREAAATALKTPAYRELLANKPELQREVIQAGAGVRTVETKTEEALRREFERRRADQVRMSYIAFVFLVILLAIMWLQVQPLAPLAFLLTLAVLAGYALFTWQNWRCPQCSKNLWSKTPRVDPWRTRGESRCPHCGIQLR